jgi:hypothetical protein
VLDVQEKYHILKAVKRRLNTERSEVLERRRRLKAAQRLLNTTQW